jgi:hypothetical protein
MARIIHCVNYLDNEFGSTGIRVLTPLVRAALEVFKKDNLFWMCPAIRR